MAFSYILMSTVASGLLLLVCLLRIGRRPANLPPGPPTLPILGNIHLMPSRDAHKQFQKWAQEYGPVYSLILGTKVMIVLSSDVAVKDLLDKRGVIYSGRPEAYVAQDLCSGGLRFLMVPYGDTWRMMRKMAHGLLNISVAKSYVVYQMLENKQMLHDMLHKPDNFLEHIRRYSNSLTTSMTYGWRSPTYEDPQVKQLFHGFEEFAEMAQTPLAALIDFYPPLRYLPLPILRRAREMHKREKKLYLGHWETVKKDLKAGTARPCFCTDMAAVQKDYGLSDDLAAYISGSFLEAGSDTTSSTLYGFMQAMLLFPEAQKKAQAELDRVVGTDRLPTMEDEPRLQYIRGCVKESLRWMPTTVLGAAPHAATKDDEYMGYLIPEGAAVMNNVYTINMDPKRFPNPRVFDPDRYQNDLLSSFDAAVSPDVSKRDHFTFGAGRHLCQGMHLAERSLFLGMSRILWAFDVLPALDSNQKEIIPDPERLTQGFVCMPEPFSARIVPRSKERAMMVEREWAEAKELLDPVTEQWKNVPEGMKFGSLD